VTGATKRHIAPQSATPQATVLPNEPTPPHVSRLHVSPTNHPPSPHVPKHYTWPSPSLGTNKEL
jgi:hypothetical protein